MNTGVERPKAGVNGRPKADVGGDYPQADVRRVDLVQEYATDKFYDHHH